MNREIQNRIQKANNVSYQLAPLLKYPAIPMETTSTIINSIFISTLTDKFQNWTITKPLEGTITPCEMRRVSKAVNKFRRVMIHNTKTREMEGTKSIHHHIQHQRIICLNVSHDCQNTKPAQPAYNSRFSGQKARRRPRKTWINGVKETLSSYNILPA